MFDIPDDLGNMATRLTNFKQGCLSVADYSVEFRVQAAESDWDEAALCDTFINGLNEQIQDELATRDLPPSLQVVVTLATRLGNRLRERQRERRAHHLFVSSQAVFTSARVHRSTSGSGEGAMTEFTAVEEPMQLGGIHLSSEERRRRLQAGLCMNCGEAGHQKQKCPVWPKGGAHQWQ